MDTKITPEATTLSPYTRIVELDGENQILFNTRNDSLVVVNSGIIQSLSLTHLSDLTTEELATLRDEGHVVSDPDADIHKFWDEYEVQCRSDHFISATVLVTTVCNLGCPYCFQHRLNKREHMSLRVAKNVAETILERSSEVSAKHIDITFSGGEPLL